MLYPWLGAQGGFGLGDVSPWVRVSTGGGCPRPWVKQGLRLGLGVLALAPAGDYVPIVGGHGVLGRVSLGWPMG